jgi:6-pyruvoyltetrahydropterin/6-carboxytetrahydropterin synthase
MFRVTRRYEFSASHRLHAPALSDEENRALYGKCNHPFGHGHNYVLEVSARGPLDPQSGYAVDIDRLDALVRGHVLDAFAHRNLNTEVEVFRTVVPTSENLGVEVFRRLRENWASTFPGAWPRLDKVRIAETPRNIFEVSSYEIE